MSPAVRMPDGRVAIVCGGRRPRPKPCHACGAPSSYLCDFEIVGATPRRKSCDRPMCEKHRTHVGADRDLCATHADRVAVRQPELFEEAP